MDRSEDLYFEAMRPGTSSPTLHPCDVPNEIYGLPPENWTKSVPNDDQPVDQSEMWVFVARSSFVVRLLTILFENFR